MKKNKIIIHDLIAWYSIFVYVKYLSSCDDDDGVGDGGYGDVPVAETHSSRGGKLNEQSHNIHTTSVRQATTKHSGQASSSKHNHALAHEDRTAAAQCHHVHVHI